MRFSFIHAADLHLDTPFTGLHRVDARLAGVLRDATTKAFENLIAAALEHRVAFVVIAGDVYDGAERGVRAQLAFRSGLERLADSGIQSFVIHGNHDPLEEGWSAVRLWPEGVTLFGSNVVGSVPVQLDGQTIAIIHGISYARRAVAENLSRRFHRAPSACLQVGVLHCNAGANADHAPYSPCSIDDLTAAGMDYWALGHVHSTQFLRRGDPWIAYSGNLQGLSPRATECGAKGALKVDVEGGRVVSVTPMPLDVVRFAEIEVDISGVPDVAGLEGLLVETARARSAASDGRALILRPILTGRGEIHADLQRAHTLEHLLDPIRVALEPESPLIWMDALEDRTRSLLDVDDLRGRGDFKADLVATADQALVLAAEGSGLLDAHLDDLPVGELRRVLGEDVDVAPTAAEIRRALDVALDHVVEAKP